MKITGLVFLSIGVFMFANGAHTNIYMENKSGITSKNISQEKNILSSSRSSESDEKIQETNDIESTPSGSTLGNNEIIIRKGASVFSREIGVISKLSREMIRFNANILNSKPNGKIYRKKISNIVQKILDSIENLVLLRSTYENSFRRSDNNLSSLDKIVKGEYGDINRVRLLGFLGMADKHDFINKKNIIKEQLSYLGELFDSILGDKINQQTASHNTSRNLSRTYVAAKLGDESASKLANTLEFLGLEGCAEQADELRRAGKVVEILGDSGSGKTRHLYDICYRHTLGSSTSTSTSTSRLNAPASSRNDAITDKADEPATRVVFIDYSGKTSAKSLARYFMANHLRTEQNSSCDDGGGGGDGERVAAARRTVAAAVSAIELYHPPNFAALVSTLASRMSALQERRHERRVIVLVDDIFAAVSPDKLASYYYSKLVSANYAVWYRQQSVLIETIDELVNIDRAGLAVSFVFTNAPHMGKSSAGTYAKGALSTFNAGSGSGGGGCGDANNSGCVVFGLGRGSSFSESYESWPESIVVNNKTFSNHMIPQWKDLVDIRITI
ncbi:hypothetical protein AYI69_g16 [Smittium culicis]|uniref:Uncharacterized protein n=1 Tax=Smittium culicis TaxID=133412 RepID=A0A1R1YU93_9FUNG|nr:hypothetical protein AYI69_g16 [Smittium culicis]